MTDKLREKIEEIAKHLAAAADEYDAKSQRESKNDDERRAALAQYVSAVWLRDVAKALRTALAAEPVWTTTTCPTCGAEVDGIRVLTEAEIGRASPAPEPAAACIECGGSGYVTPPGPHRAIGFPLPIRCPSCVSPAPGATTGDPADAKLTEAWERFYRRRERRRAMLSPGATTEGCPLCRDLLWYVANPAGGPPAPCPRCLPEWHAGATTEGARIPEPGVPAVDECERIAYRRGYRDGWVAHRDSALTPPTTEGARDEDAPCARHGAAVCEECAHDDGFREGWEAGRDAAYRIPDRIVVTEIRGLERLTLRGPERDEWIVRASLRKALATVRDAIRDLTPPTTPPPSRGEEDRNG